MQTISGYNISEIFYIRPLYTSNKQGCGYVIYEFIRALIEQRHMVIATYWRVTQEKQSQQEWSTQRGDGGYK